MTVSEKNQKYKRGQHPNSRKNLKPGYYGQDHSHNGYTLASELKQLLHKPLVRPDEDAPVREHILYATIQGALKRETAPFKEVWDRSDGKLTDMPSGFQDNRVINIIVSSEKAKELTEGVGKFEIFKQDVVVEE